MLALVVVVVVVVVVEATLHFLSVALRCEKVMAAGAALSSYHLAFQSVNLEIVSV